MYMAPITDARRTAAVPAALRMAVGALVLLVPVAAMLPWLADSPAVSGVVLAVLALARGPRALLRSVDDAGRVALAR